MKNIIVIDYSNIIHSMLYSAENASKRNVSSMGEFDIYGFWKHLVINSILQIIKKTKKDGCGNEVVIAYDAKDGYWRKEFYPPYKGDRKKQRDKNTIDFEEFFKMANEFEEKFKDIFRNFKHIRVSKCEADDIAATIVKNNIDKDVNIVLVSRDKDWQQCLSYNFVQIWDPFKNKFKKIANPKKYIKEKVLMRDSDNIPPVKPRIGEKTAKKIVKEGFFNWVKRQPEPKLIEENYWRNKKLMDFDEIPKEIHNKIIDEYNNQKTFRFDFMSAITKLNNEMLNKISDNMMNGKYNSLLNDIK